MLDLVASSNYQPMVVFPASYADEGRVVLSSPPLTNKPPLFIMPDGTWSEARKMFRKSPWLDALPIISVDLSISSAYCLRVANVDGQYCTAEVAAALLEQAGDIEASLGLTNHFTLFRKRYLAGKPYHQVSITAAKPESV